MSESVVVAGVGMIPFAKPGRSDPYDVMGETAARLALGDAGIPFDKVQQAFVGYVYGDSTCGQAVLYGLGMTGIPIFNVNNNCSTGSTALFMARQAVQAGSVECALALGFEEMRPGALSADSDGRVSPLQRFIDELDSIQGEVEGPVTARWFGGAGQEYIDTYGMEPSTMARISVKARAHAEHNPKAIFREPLGLQEVMDSPRISGPLTRYQCCPPTCGAAAAVVCSEEFARRHSSATPVRILAQAMTTDFASTFEGNSLMKLVGFDMAQAAAEQVYEASGIGPDDVDVVELHDCFTANEVLTYEALGLTPEGTAEKFILDGDNTYGGKVVTNPSGGLLSKGHPLGATGLAQCAELVEQIRGSCGVRQVEGARVALQHNLGLGGACVVTMYGSAN
jgi:acetyl-CoA acetyltransferase